MTSETASDSHFSYAALRVSSHIAGLDELLGVIATLRKGKAEERTISALVAIPDVQRLIAEWTLFERLAEREDRNPHRDLLGHLDEDGLEQARYALWGTTAPKLRRVK